jgi:hypothetical protein
MQGWRDEELRRSIIPWGNSLSLIRLGLSLKLLVYADSESDAILLPIFG